MQIRPDRPGTWRPPLTGASSGAPDRFVPGTVFVEKKTWRWPWTHPYRPVDPGRVSERLEKGEALSARTPDCPAPMALRSPEDLDDLEHSQRSEHGLPAALRALGEQGWRFESETGQMLRAGADVRNASSLANQAAHVLDLGSSRAAGPALESLGGVTPGLARAWRELEPDCRSELARKLLMGRLLAHPHLGEDDGSQQTLVVELFSDLRRYGVPREERAAMAAARLDRLLAGPADPEAIACQASLAGELGDGTAAPRALDALVARPECAGLARARVELEPACQSEQARRLLHERLLASPLRGADDAAQSQLVSETLSFMGSHRVSSQEQATLSAACLDSLLRRPLSASQYQPLAERTLSMVDFGDRTAAERAIAHLSKAFPTMASIFADLRADCRSEEAFRILVGRLLAQPDVPDRCAFFEKLDHAWKSHGVASGERQALLGGELDRAISRLPGSAAEVGKLAELASEAGDRTALERGLTALGGLEPVAAILADWRPLAPSPEARAALVPALMKAPPRKGTPEERDRVRQLWLESLKRQGQAFRALERDLERFESERAARREVQTLAGPERTASLAEGKGQLVVGGVVLPKRGGA